MIFVSDCFGNFTKAASTGIGHDEFDVVATILGGVSVSIFDHAAAHFGDFFYEETRFVYLSGSGVLIF